eukprot:SAG31_NODE_19485_length_600_cov_1.161677_2_plen_23_part_01
MQCVAEEPMSYAAMSTEHVVLVR